jgi:Sec-independent protein translocase protein TatA
MGRYKQAQKNWKSFGKYEFMLDDNEDEIEEPKPRNKQKKEKNEEEKDAFPKKSKN